MKRNKEKKELEYEDAPSGFVTLYNFKEPFMPFEPDNFDKGFGYEGVLLFDGTSDTVQCHFCGKWYEALGHHLHKEHNMNAYDYKKIVGLSQTTALIGEKYREKLIAVGQERFKNLRPGKKKSQLEKNKIRATMKDFNREKQNIRGTCPAQLLDRLEKLSVKLGRCPTEREVQFLDALTRTYGTFSHACKLVGLVSLKPGQTLNKGKTKFNFDFFYKFVRDFWIINGKFPRSSDVGTNFRWEKYQLIRKEVEKKVLYGEGKFHDTPIVVHYSKQELSDMIKNFKEVNGRNPSTSDCKRGLLPHASRFYYHFGSLKNAINYEKTN